MSCDGALSPASRQRWYVVQTQAGREALALRHLANQHFVTFCPKRRRTRMVGRRKVTSLCPFFPGYIFVNIDLERQPWRSINGTIGIIRLVSSGDFDGARPSPLPTGLIEQFRELSGDAGELRFRESLSPGQKVRVIGGPFDQLCGTLETEGDLGRVTILLNLLTNATRVSLGRGVLVAA